jgi:hypothetical protein
MYFTNKNGDMMNKRIQCDICDQIWSANPDDYPLLREEEQFVCTCGNALFRKAELFEEEPSLIQPAK